jgi:hypothetical protein
LFDYMLVYIIDYVITSFELVPMHMRCFLSAISL